MERPQNNNHNSGNNFVGLGSRQLSPHKNTKRKQETPRPLGDSAASSVPPAHKKLTTRLSTPEVSNSNRKELDLGAGEGFDLLGGEKLSIGGHGLGANLGDAAARRREQVHRASRAANVLSIGFDSHRHGAGQQQFHHRNSGGTSSPEQRGTTGRATTGRATTGRADRDSLDQFQATGQSGSHSSGRKAKRSSPHMDVGFSQAASPLYTAPRLSVRRRPGHGTSSFSFDFGDESPHGDAGASRHAPNRASSRMMSGSGFGRDDPNDSLSSFASNSSVHAPTPRDKGNLRTGTVFSFDQAGGSGGSSGSRLSSRSSSRGSSAASSHGSVPSPMNFHGVGSHHRPAVPRFQDSPTPASRIDGPSRSHHRVASGSGSTSLHGVHSPRPYHVVPTQSDADRRSESAPTVLKPKSAKQKQPTQSLPSAGAQVTVGTESARFDARQLLSVGTCSDISRAPAQAPSMGTPLSSGIPKLDTTAPNGDTPRAEAGSRPSSLRSTAQAVLHFGISNRITHRTIPQLNKALINNVGGQGSSVSTSSDGKRGPAGFSAAGSGHLALGPPPTAKVPRRMPGRLAIKNHGLFLDCDAVEKEKDRAPPPLSCRVGMSAAASTNVCSLITDGLYVGGAHIARNAQELKRLGITHVVNCVASQCPCLAAGHGLEYLSFSMRDNGTEDITKYIYTVFSFITAAHEQKGKVLIHCMRGISRSGSLAIAWVIHSCRMALDGALRFCRQRRACISPNATFIMQLSDWALHRPSVLSTTATHVYRVEAAPRVFNASGVAGKREPIGSSNSGGGGFSPNAKLPPGQQLSPSSFDSSSSSSDLDDELGGAGAAIVSLARGTDVEGGDPDLFEGDLTEDEDDEQGNVLGAVLDHQRDRAQSFSATLDYGGSSALVPLLVGPLCHFSARMFTGASTTDEHCYVVVADGVLFLWQSSPQRAAAAVLARPPSSTRNSDTGGAQPQSEASTNGHPRNNVVAGSRRPTFSRSAALSESQHQSRSRFLLESAADLLKKFENCGDREVQWVEDQLEPPEFWSAFAQIPQRQGVRLTPDLRSRKVIPALQHFEQLNI